MFNPTWFVAGIVYAAGVWLARKHGVALPRRVALFFYLLVFVFFYRVLTQDAVNTSVDYLGTLPPWEYTAPNHHAGNPQLNDLALQIVPWAHQVREGWRSGHAPLWNAASAAGYPLLASAQSSALSPLRLLGLPLSLAHALSFEAAMKVLLALTFMFLWCRRRYSEIASVCGAVAFGFSTFVIVWLHFPLITTACFVPAVFLALDLLAARLTYARFVFLAVIGAVMLFGGHPETVSHTAFLAALFVLWLIFAERVTPRILVAITGAAVVTVLLAAPLLLPFAEALPKSKRYQELEGRVETGEVQHIDATSTALLISPRFPPAGHAEAISGFAGILGAAAWIAVALQVIATRSWRSREAFLVLATLLCLGIILDWPLIGDAFHLLFSLAANARVRLLLVLLLATLTAAAIDRAKRREMLAGIAGAGALLLVVFFAMQHELGAAAMLPSVAVLLIALLHVARASARDPGRASAPETGRASAPETGRAEARPTWGTLALLVAITAELWSATRDWNPVVSQDWMYPKTAMLRALDDAAKQQKEPFRIVANTATFFPNVSALYGYEDVRAHDPMTPGRYVGLLSLVIGYDPSEYFAPWTEWDHPLLDYLNVRYVLTSAGGGELPWGFHQIYSGSDGRLFENDEVLPRFFAVPNVVIEFRDAVYPRTLRNLSWKDTALLDALEVEVPRMHDDFFRPRPANAPVAVATIVSATPTDYRLHVTAPRWSLVVSSVPWWPGWKVARNGVRAKPIRVNGAFLGFAVPPGELDVRIWYDPWTFRVGAIVSAATLTALVAYGVRRR
ncbi:MAG TPA: YfhO family protein [Thermoanaerobaculia bacterium]|nr:YfhO family protein [Thermoanaerobaculia bacterium]